MPPGVITVTLATPVPAGLTAVIVVALTTVTFVAVVVPKLTSRGTGKAGAGDRHRSAANRRTSYSGLMPVTIGVAAAT